MKTLATVKEHFEVGSGVRLMRLEAPAIAQNAGPGQFVMLRVAHGPEPLLARPFSIHGVEGNEILILYKIVGRGTKLLRLARPGKKKLVLWGPLGRGFKLSAQRPLLVAGGMGIAPLVFACRRLLERGLNPACLYGAPSESAFSAPAEKQTGGRLLMGGAPWQTTTEDGSFGQKGLVTDILRELLELPQSIGPDEVLACGPLAMLKAVAGVCAEHGTPCQVSMEAPMACGLGACLGCALPKTGGGFLRACREGPVLAAESMDWSRM